MEPMQMVARRTVRLQEIDDMGHMNVRYYMQHASDAMATLTALLGLGARRAHADGLAWGVREQHIRFHREMRTGATFTIFAGIVEAAADHLRVYKEIRLTETDQVVATITSVLALLDQEARLPRALPADLRDKALGLTTAIPTHGAVRGLAWIEPRIDLTRAEAEAMGLYPCFLGPVRAEYCDRDGFMTPMGYMGRISDGIRNLHARYRDVSGDEDGPGGAVVEYRLVYHQPPRVDDIVVVMSGLHAVTDKAIGWMHLLFDHETNGLVGTAEAVAVRFDLATRKAVPIPAQDRASMERILIPELAS